MLLHEGFSKRLYLGNDGSGLFLSVGGDGAQPSRNLVTPTGTMATLATPGYISDSSRSVRSRAGPSLTPGRRRSGSSW